MIINSFRGDYFFLSNFYDCKIEYGGLVYHNSEALFQSFKTTDWEDKKRLSEMDPRSAKSFGRKVELVSNWEQIKVRYMYHTLVEKFTQNPDLAKKLIATGDAVLIECNNWRDTYWGVCGGKGSNRLGLMLMLIRQELNEGKYCIK